MSVNPATSAQGNEFVLGVMKYCVRHNVATNFPHEVGVLKTHFDLALHKSLLDYRNNKLNKSEWWDVYKPIVGLVLPVSSAEKCFACKTAWEDVQDDLSALVRSSNTGVYLFGKAMQSIAESDVEQLVDAAIFGLKGTAVTVDAINKCKGDLVASIKRLGKDPIDTFTTPKTITVSCLGTQVEVSCLSILDVFQTRLWAFLKTVAIVSGQLAELYCEKELSLGAVTAGTKVDEGILAPARAARKTATGYIENGEINSELIKDIFKRKGQFLLRLDRTFRVEIAFFLGACGAGGEGRCHEAILACLPDSSGVSAVEDALGKLQSISMGKLVAWCGAGMLATVQAVLKYVCTKDVRPS